MSVVIYKGPAPAAIILPVKVTHTTGCLKRAENRANLHTCTYVFIQYTLTVVPHAYLECFECVTQYRKYAHVLYMYRVVCTSTHHRVRYRKCDIFPIALLPMFTKYRVFAAFALIHTYGTAG
jgi:hypothetical protein